MNPKVKNLLPPLAGLGAVCALAVIAAFFDLEINKALFFPEALFGQFFAKVGEFPSHLAAPTVGVILFFQDFGKSKSLRNAFKILFGALTVVGFYTFFSWFIGVFSHDLQYAYAYHAAFSAIFSGLSLYICSKVPRSVMKKLLWFAVCLAVAAIIANVVIAAIKPLWARERFRVMVGGEDRALLAQASFDGFSPWYLPQKFAERSEEYIKNMLAIDESMGYHNDAFRSFPSGHTGAASIAAAVIVLGDIFPEKFRGKKRVLLFAAPIAYTAIVALSRIVIGAHFLSDVLFGGVIGLGAVFLTRLCFLKIRKKFDNGKQSREAV
ncbi:MAG: phosphatase PAP2 family protein [Clostridiales bacterium]|jgi:membrane-associated phospholipid phosphatase|nr:phosphatase PAP2 family protein [Clostridiales bacterium]